MLNRHPRFLEIHCRPTRSGRSRGRKSHLTRSLVASEGWSLVRDRTNRKQCPSHKIWSSGWSLVRVVVGQGFYCILRLFIHLYYYRSRVCKNLSAKFDQFLAARSQFDSDHRVDFSLRLHLANPQPLCDRFCPLFSMTTNHKQPHRCD